MEEARQHTPLTAEKIVFAVVYFGGLLALLGGVVFQFILGGKSVQVGLVGFLASRAITSFWQAVHPQSALVSKPSRGFAFIAGIILLAFAYGVGLPFWAYR